MNPTITGVLAAVLIVAGIALLVVYAMRRGLVHKDLPDTIATAEVPTSAQAPTGEPASQPRTLGAVGVLVLIVGLALGAVTAMNTGAGAGAGTGGSGSDCAAGWAGCPGTTVPPASTQP